METLNQKKPLGFWLLTSLVVGNMVGSGIFLLPASLAKFGSISLLSWGVTTIGAFLMAIIFSKMSILVPKDGGPFAYAKAGLGDFIGFQTAYTHWIAIWVGNLALVIAMMGYLSSIWPALANPTTSVIISIITVWLLVGINSGIKTASVIQLATVILRLIPIALLIALGITFFNPHYLSQNFDLTVQPPIMDITQAAGLTLWAFIGIESATIPYSRIENPRRMIPLATLCGTAIAAIIYILSSTIITGILPHEILANSASPFIAAAQVIFGDIGGKLLITIGAIISCFGSAIGWTMLQGQVAMAAADDGLFPGVFAIRNRFGVPVLGLIVTACLETALLFLTINKDSAAQFNLVMLMASLAAIIPYFYTMVASLIIIKQENIQKQKIYFLIASLAAIYAFWALFTTGEKALFYGSILILSSALLYGWGYGEKKNIAV